MNKKSIITISMVAVAFVIIILAYVNLNGSGKNLSDEEIKNKYCHVTAEIRKTDIYCQNPELYRQHVKENNVIQ